MNIPENHLHKLIDGLTQSTVSFALYRLPWKEQPVLVLQRQGEAETYARLQDLNGKTGFVLAPFTGRLGKCLGGHDSAKQ